MTEIILTVSLILFGALIGSQLISLRKLEIENKQLRQEIVQLEWEKIKK